MSQLAREVPASAPAPASRPAAEPCRPGGPPKRRTWVDRLVDPIRWEPGHQRLAALPVFAACSRSDIRELARAGDECFVPAGTVLCREGRIGYWLFVVTSGSVQLLSGEGGAGNAGAEHAAVATLRAGSHFGDAAILGFGPQPVTAQVLEDATLFVLGRRHVLDLVHSMDGFRAGLFPGVGASAMTTVVRDLRSSGMKAWHALPRRSVDELVAGDRVEQLPPTIVAVPTKTRFPVGPSPFASALSLGASAALPAVPSSSTVTRLDRRIVAAVALAAMGAVLAFSLLFRPDVLIVRPSGTIDVSDDVVVEGLPPPSGRYVLTAVDIEETNLAGLAVALLRGDETVPRADGAAGEADDRMGRASYRRSQTVAAEVVARRAGLDPAAVRFRDRGLVGPSAGLLYALVLADMTDVVDVPRGRVVAATGELTADGRVGAVGYVGVKHEVARRAGATVFLVPASAGGAGAARGTIAVSTLDEALAAVGS